MCLHSLSLFLKLLFITHHTHPHLNSVIVVGCYSFYMTYFVLVKPSHQKSPPSIMDYHRLNLKADVMNRHSTDAKLQQKQIPPSCSASSFCLLLAFVSYIFSWGLPLNSQSSHVSGFKPELLFPSSDCLFCFSAGSFQTELARAPVWHTLGDTHIIQQINPIDPSPACKKQSVGLDSSLRHRPPLFLSYTASCRRLSPFRSIMDGISLLPLTQPYFNHIS